MPAVAKLKIAPTPTPRRTAARSELADKIVARKEAEQDLREAHKAVENAIEQRRALEREWQELLGDKAPLDDDVVAALAAGKLDARGRTKAGAEHQARLDELEAAARNLAEAKAVAERAVKDRERALEYSRRACDAAARVVISECVDADRLEKNVERARAELERAMQAATDAYSVCASGTETSRRAQRLTMVGMQIDSRVGDASPLRLLLARLLNDPDATL